MAFRAPNPSIEALANVPETLGDVTLVDEPTACAALGNISRWTLWRMVKRHALPIHKVGASNKYAIGDLRRIVEASRKVAA